MSLFRDRPDPEPAYDPPLSPLGSAAPAPPLGSPYAGAPDPVVVPAHRPVRPEWAQRADRGDFVKWAFYAGLASGVLILLCAFSVALLMTLMALLGGPDLDWVWAGDPDGDWSPAAPFLFATWGLLSGGAVLLGALRLKEQPESSAMPGIVMLAGGLLSFFVLGGFLVGGLLAIVAGVLAIAGARSVVLVRGPRTRGERPPSGF